MTRLRSSQSVRRITALVRRAWFLPLVVGALAASCSDEDAANGGGGLAGSAGAGGQAMSGGSGGLSMGSAGSGLGGSGGMAMAGAGGMNLGGAGGMGMAGGGGMGMGGGAMASGGGTGFLEVLNEDATALLTPTTAAIVGDSVWVAIGQLGQLFVDPPAPSLPFKAVSIPLSGGAVSAEAIEFAGFDDFFLEGIAAGPAGELFLGAVTRGQIVRVAPETTQANPFMNQGLAERGVVGLAVDAARELVWYCDSNPLAEVPGGALVGVSTAGGSTGVEVVRHNFPVNLVLAPPPEPIPAADVDAGVADAGLDAGAPGLVAPPPAVDAGAAIEVAPFCNDVIVLSDGDLLATDSTGRIFRVASANVLTADSAEVWLKAFELQPPTVGGFGVNGLDIVGTALIVANSDLGSLIQIDPTSDDPASTLRSLPITEGGFVKKLCGPDGLASVPGSDNQLVVVENGFCDTGIARIIKVTLDLN